VKRGSEGRSKVPLCRAPRIVEQRINKRDCSAIASTAANRSPQLNFLAVFVKGPFRCTGRQGPKLAVWAKGDQRRDGLLGSDGEGVRPSKGGREMRQLLTERRGCDAATLVIVNELLC
jgi:hypothetical protein